MMELDNIKSGWQNLNVKSVIDEEKLQNIIRKRGHGAHASLVRWETFALVLLIFILPICLVYLYTEKLYVALYFTLSCIAGGVWQFYKLRCLKGIDLMGMPVTKVAPKVANYRKYIQYELYIGLIWFIGWMILMVISNNRISLYGILTAAIIGIISILIMLYVYKKIFINKIKSINDSLDELREFEAEN